MAFSLFSYAADEPNKTCLCIAGNASGFKFESGQWEAARFNTSEKYLLKIMTEKHAIFPEKVSGYGLFKFGSNDTLSGCGTSLSAIFSKSGRGEFKFRKYSMRFLLWLWMP